VKSKIINWLAIVLILEIGLLHFFTAQSEYAEAAYMGYLFMANFLGGLISAYLIYHKQFLGWMIGLAVALGSIAGYAWSRTLGMPGMNVEEWFTPYGVVALSLETLFILLLLFRPWNYAPAQEPETRLPRLLRFPAVLLGLLVIGALSVGTVQWDSINIQSFGHHVGSLDQVCSTRISTMAEVEANYGVQVALVATSLMGGVVDVRLKIVDPEKAHAFLQNQAAVLVNQQALILAPHMHSHSMGRLKEGKMFIIFFPTQQIIHPGSEISLVFGNVRMEPVTVK
jgi:hypothetical protein